MNVIVTGTSKGIGLEFVKQGLAKGHSILAVARAPEKSSALMKLKDEYPEHLSISSVDLTHPEAAHQIAAAAKNWPAVDLLINNAGISAKGVALGDFLSSFHVNSVAPFLITQALMSKLRESRNPKVVQITSLMGSIADNSMGGYYPYRASKAALNMINKSLSLDHKWMTAVVLHPGWVKTDMGGSEAPTPVQESVQGLWRVIEEVGNEESGKFFDFKGKELPW